MVIILSECIMQGHMVLDLVLDRERRMLENHTHHLFVDQVQNIANGVQPALLKMCFQKDLWNV